MDAILLQQLVVGAIVLAAALYALNRVRRAVASARKSKGGCGSDCGCGE